MNVEVYGTEGEASKNLAAALYMEVGRVSDEGEGAMLAMEATGYLTQEDDTGGMTLVDVRNEFNKLSHLSML